MATFFSGRCNSDSVNGNFQFSVSVEKFNFSTAREACQTVSGRDVATLFNSDHQFKAGQFLENEAFSSIPRSDVYFGLVDESQESTEDNSTSRFSWASGNTDLSFSSGLAGSFPWGINQPDNGDGITAEDCVVLKESSTFTWEDISCETALPVLCMSSCTFGGFPTQPPTTISSSSIGVEKAMYVISAIAALLLFAVLGGIVYNVFSKDKDKEGQSQLKRKSSTKNGTDPASDEKSENIKENLQHLL